MRGIPAWTIGALLLGAAGAAAGSASIFDLEKEASPRFVVTGAAEAPAADAVGGMLGELHGVVAVMSKPDVAKLRACEPKEPGAIGRPADGETVCFVHVVGLHGAKVVEIVRAGDGHLVAEEQGTGLERPPREELNAERFEALSEGWTRYRGTFDSEAVAEARGEVFEVEQPYSVGRFVLDKSTLGERFLGGGKSEKKAERVLSEEVFRARLPAGYDPKKPAGVLVWVNAGNEGSPPEVFAAGADAMGLIVIGADRCGNDRSPQERYQLALDEVATAQRRWHVDPRRVYVTGLSGGGGISSMLAACFPDVYTGAVPICRLSSYKVVPTGVGGGWAAEYRRPPARLFAMFKQHPMGAITGEKDFNHAPVTSAADVMKRDGVNVRVFDYEGMGHEMPTAERFSEVMAWVDGPYQEMVKADEEAAGKAMTAYRERYPEGGAPDETARRMLMKVMEAGAWTETGWEAARVLEGK